MEVTPTPISGLLLLKPAVYHDDRGYFFESFNKSTLARLGYDWEFLQDNESMSLKNVLRGLHFQLPPHAQGKLIRVVSGEILDVAVDLRRQSPTYGHWFAARLSSENKLLMWIPEGFAHGFLSLHDNTRVAYKCTRVFNQEAERSIRWNDPDLAIDWGIENPIISERDHKAPLLKNFTSPF
jgi:dTDP-4-dehydrorhamnose 3,5-epimerase